MKCAKIKKTTTFQYTQLIHHTSNNHMHGILCSESQLTSSHNQRHGLRCSQVKILTLQVIQAWATELRKYTRITCITLEPRKYTRITYNIFTNLWALEKGKGPFLPIKYRQAKSPSQSRIRVATQPCNTVLLNQQATHHQS